jgi:type IV pilus assembly protein PilA
MHDIITRLRAKKGDEGFTLIELLVVVVIIGVLVAIAVPVYLNYRKGAADKSAQSDVRGAVSAIEQYYTDNGNAYPTGTLQNWSGTGSSLTTSPGFSLYGAGGTSSGGPTSASQPGGWITASDKTQLTYVFNTTSGTYLVCGTNTGGSGKVYLYNSQNGGSVQASSPAVSIATCK